MYYLSVDTDVWLNLLSEDFSKDNRFDEFFYWIDNDEIIILLPENIVAEFNRNIITKHSEIIREINKVFNSTKEVLKRIDEYNKLSTSELAMVILEDRKKRINYLFEKKAIRFESGSEKILLAAAKRTLLCKAPNHSKDSYKDTVNIISIINFLKENKFENAYFVTENYSDFSKSKGEKYDLHDDLVEEFSKADLKYFYGFNRLFHSVLRNNLSSFKEFIERQKTEEEAIKLKNSLSLHILDHTSSGYEDVFLDNTSHIDLILKKVKPTKHEIGLIISLAKNDISYQKYFFERVEKPIWFKILFTEGYFNIGLNPQDINNLDNTKLPYYPPIYFITKVSETFVVRQNTDLIETVIKIIDEVSEQGGNNYITWLHFIRILINIPSEAIPLKVLRHLPVWLQNGVRFSLPTIELCEKLLPKFLSDAAGEDDIKKGRKNIAPSF